MTTLTYKLIAKAKQACVAYYHLCTDYDDWGTLDTHWLQVNLECPAPGYINRFFIRVKDSRGFDVQTDRNDLMYGDRGCLVVTFLRGEITQTEWYIMPKGRRAHPLENYKHRDDRIPEIPKPESYGVWS